MRADDATDATDATDLTRLIRGYQFTQALYAAARLGLPDLVADGPQPTTDLAGRCGVAAPVLARLLRALTTLGVFAEVAPDTFGPTPRSHLLRPGVPGSQRADLLLAGADLYPRWGHFLQALQTGETTAQIAYGMGAWAWRAQHPEMSAIFDDAMVEHSRARVAALVAAYDFAPFGTIVDIGGGRGALLAEILRATPSARGVLFDQPHVVAGAAAVFAAAGVADRARVAPGDFFAAVSGGGDAYILSMILHDWDDERSLAILARCREAMAVSGTLLLVERALPVEGVDRPWEPFFSDLHMLAGLGGRERSAADWRALLAAAHFDMTRIVPTTADASLIEARPTAAA